MIPEIIYSVGIFAMGFIFGLLIPNKKKVDALLDVKETEEKLLYNFLVLIPIDDISKRKYLNVEVIKNGKNPQR